MSDFKRVINVIPLTRVNLASTQIFTYLVPLELHDQMRPGQLVKIPFGKKQILGVISSFEMHRLEKEIKGLKVLQELLDPLPVLNEQALELANFLAHHYVAPLGLVVKAMLPKFVKKPRDPQLVGYERSNPDFVLTEYQRQAVNQISSSLGRTRTFLLFGVTGSGKTEVYLRLIQRVLEEGKQVIMLVPEISLTPQAIERLARRFGIENIALLHSGLRDSERTWMWQKIRSKEKKIIVGPRSAVFSPVQDLGLIILDEEHDPSFKQFDQNPKYHARTAAKKLCELWQCPLILGDATPALETFYETVSGGGVLLPLPYRIKADVGLPQVKIVDMRRETAARNFSVLSEYLKLAILDNLHSGKQVILFLNRRGSATFVTCRECGFTLACRNCSVNLVWHSSARTLLCHHCGTRYQIPPLCPSCQGSHFGYFGIGTQLVEMELKKFLAKNIDKKSLPIVERMDRDTTAKRETGTRIYQDWASGRTHILIGTQIISKGWDVSRVGLVGIISADTTLLLPDFRSNERTFQILTQVAGRAGRGSQTGLVILQTYHPENYAVQAVKTHDYEKFFKAEIAERRKFFYPPFAQLVKLTASHINVSKAEELASRVYRDLLKKDKPSLEIFGPVPAFIFRVRGEYRFQIILKLPAGHSLDLYKLLEELPSVVDIDVDPNTLL